MILTINGLNLAYDDCGQGPALLLIHGFPLNRQMWQPQLLPLARAGYRVVAPDLRGFGESDAPEGSYSIEVFADDLIALLDALQIEQAVVGGMSMGGYILMNMLERYPERVRAACFITTKSTDDDEAARARRSEMAAQAERWGSNPITKIFAELLFGEETAEEKPELIARVTSWMRGTAPEGLSGGLLAMRDRKDYTPLLPGFRQPSLVIAGAEDRAAAPNALELLTGGLPGCRTLVVPKAGHMVNLEQPEVFNAAVIEFLKGMPERA